jgi:hypothetical protein
MHIDCITQAIVIVWRTDRLAPPLMPPSCIAE